MLRRTPLKSGQTPLKRSPLKKSRPKSAAQIVEEQEHLRKRNEFFTTIWQDRLHICFECSLPINGKEPLTIYFHHVLPKHKYPEYEFSDWNIVLLRAEIHAEVETDIDKCPRVKELYLDLLEKHKNKQLKP